VRAPYWQCLGVDDGHPEVRREVEDWFLSMDEDERISFVKERLRERRYFNGALDGQRTEDFDQALGQYRRAMGLNAIGALDLEFFRQFAAAAVPAGPLAAPKRPVPAPSAGVGTGAGAAASNAPSAATNPGPAVAAVAGPVIAPVIAPVAAPAPASPSTPQAATAGPEPTAAALRLINLSPQPQGGVLAPVQLRVTVDQPGYVYCYAQDPQSQAIRRIFPNRFARDPRVQPGRALALPSAGRFSLPATHRYACLHAPTEVYGDLPPPLRWGDFDDVRLKSFEAIRQQFVAASGQAIGLGELSAR
jgi:Domain of unknown function (DUF4384)